MLLYIDLHCIVASTNILFTVTYIMSYLLPVKSVASLRHIICITLFTQDQIRKTSLRGKKKVKC